MNNSIISSRKIQAVCEENIILKALSGDTVPHFTTIASFISTNGEKPRIGTGGEEVQSNITDNESAKIKGSHGYVQGYNGLAAADSAHQIIVAAN
ncbi:hypothetical protein AGMMS50268_22300 [Spirochaetia bacterium]|nr:hypothetical protein AGMMS50268_22300 [Spirochaetia bacterium]